MPFIPHGKKSAKKLAAAKSERGRDAAIDMAIAAVKCVVNGPRTCLQMAVVLERFMTIVMPKELFAARLGALLVEGAKPLAFDPRGPEGVDGGFHAWIEGPTGELIDASIATTLAAEGYPIDADIIVQAKGPRFTLADHHLRYEVLPGLELRNLAESEGFIESALAIAFTGRSPPGTVLDCPLDIGWRAGRS